MTEKDKLRKLHSELDKNISEWVPESDPDELIEIVYAHLILLEKAISDSP